MQSIVFEQFGEPAEVLVLRDVPTPKPQRGEIRVRMLVSPVNPSDLMTVRGIYGKLPELPATPGMEGVGIVEHNGGGLLGRLLLGKRVAVLNRETGNWCRQAVIPARQAIPLPSDLPLEQAAMFFVNPVTAYVMTRVVLNVPRGAWLIQTAAGSAVGRMVIRLGKHFGFRTLNIVRRTEQIDELKSLGGDAVLRFDAKTDDVSDFRNEVRRVTGDTGVGFGIDPVGGETGSAVVGCLGDGGRMLVYGTLSGEPLNFSPRALMTPGAQIEGFWLARWMLKQKLLSKLRLVRTVTKLMRANVLGSEVGRSFALEQIAEAVREAEKPARGGKVLLRIADE